MGFRPKWTEGAAATFHTLQAEALASLQNRRKNQRTQASKTEGLYKQVEKCARLLLENPRHPGLQTHAFTSIEHPYENGGKVFEAYVQNRTPGAYRLFLCYGPRKGEITTITITPHP